MKKQKALFSGIILLTVIILATVAITAGIVAFISSEDTSDITSETILNTPGGIEQKLSSQNSTVDNTDMPDHVIQVYFFDVGQADSTLLILPDNKTMLIDAGTSDTSLQLESDIRSLGITRIDILVATHPHADHIGGMSHIINSFETGEIYMPEVSHTSRTFENLLTIIAVKGLKVFAGTAGTLIDGGDLVSIQIISPDIPDDKNLNNSSLVIRVDYGEISFLFMGDAEIPIENTIMSSVYEYSADVIKVGHHGSSTSSGLEFINGVKPGIAIISVGADNRYNHPSDEIIERYESLGATVYRTDIHGTVNVTADKKKLTVFTSK